MSQKRRTAADEPFFLVRSLAAEHASGQSTSRHGHDWGQLIYAAAGVCTVWTEAGSWIAPPHWAVWVPAGVTHSIRFAGPAALRTLYLRPDLALALPAECGVITVSPLLRELIIRAVGHGMLDERDATDRALAHLIVGECHHATAPPFDLATPTSEACRRAVSLFETGDAALTTAAIARRVGLSTRSLERRFRLETGVTLGQWRRQAALLAALQVLALGKPVKAAAETAGYRTASAFVAAFHANFGTTPGRYFQPS